MKFTLHDTLNALYIAGDSPYISEAVPAGTDKAKLEVTASTGYTDKPLAEEWDDLRNLLSDNYQTFRNELINTFSAAAVWDTLSDNSKKALIRNHVWKSTETIPNLDLLYTQAERDQFLEDAVILLNDCDCNLQKVISDGSYWNMLPNANGNLEAAKLGTDVTTDAAIPSTISFAELYMTNSNTNTVIAAIDTMTKIAGTTTKGEASSDFTHANNKLTYTGAKTKKFNVTTTSTMVRATGTGDKLGRFAIFKNGAEETKTLSGNKDVGTPTETTFQGIIEMAKDDYIEMFVENKTDAEDFTVKNMTVTAVEIKQ